MAEQVKTTICQIDKIEIGIVTLISLDDTMESENISMRWLPEGSKESDVVEVSLKVLPELKEREKEKIEDLLGDLKGNNGSN